MITPAGSPVQPPGTSLRPLRFDFRCLLVFKDFQSAFQPNDFRFLFGYQCIERLDDFHLPLDQLSEFVHDATPRPRDRLPVLDTRQRKEFLSQFGKLLIKVLGG